MEGIVAKRTLKKSYYNNNSNYILTDNLNNKENKGNRKENFKEKIIYKTSLKAITMTAILVFVFAIKYLNISIVMNSTVVDKIKKEYKKSYSSEQIIGKTKEIYENILLYIKPIVPDTIENSVNSVIKKLNTKQIVEKKNNNNEVKIYEEDSNNKSENKKQSSILSIGGSVEKNDLVVSASSSISVEQEISNKIKESGVKFVLPVKGTVTSCFGAREEIFEGIDSYHTGIDIGADKGEKVIASCLGKVSVATYNKYNGNYVEITNGKIVTKYCHLSKIHVKVGDKVKVGQKIGEVGSTGLSTGPHLHFEIVYDGVKINPELILDFKI